VIPVAAGIATVIPNVTELPEQTVVVEAVAAVAGNGRVVLQFGGAMMETM